MKEKNEQSGFECDEVSNDANETVIETASQDANNAVNENSNANDDVAATEIQNVNDNLAKAPDSKDDDDIKKSSTSKKNYKAFIIEGIIAVIAIAVIITIVAINGKKSSTTISVNEAYGEMPDLITAEEFNPSSEEDCKAKLDSGEMLKLESDNGYVYVVNYKDTEKVKEKVTPSDEDLDELINSGILASYAEQSEITDRDVVQLNDTVSINYIGRVDGEEFDGGTGSYDLTIGSGSFIDDFEDQLIGAKVGETLDVTVTFPEDYGVDELNGKEAVFEVTINDLLYSITYPELTDEIAADFFSSMDEDITTVEGCIEYCTNYITEYNIYQLISDSYYASEIDKNMVIAFYNDTMSYYDQMAAQYGTDLESLLSSSGSSLEDIKKDVVSNACMSSAYMEVISAIAKDLNIEINDDDMLNFISNEGYTNLEDYYSQFGSENTLKYYVLEDKVTSTLSEMFK